MSGEEISAREAASLEGEITSEHMRGLAWASCEDARRTGDARKYEETVYEDTGSNVRFS